MVKSLFLRKNTLTLDDIADGMAYVAISSLSYLILHGRFLNDTERVQFWNKRKKIYSGGCSDWHASKICVLADSLARNIASNELMLAHATNVYSNGTHEDKQDWNAEIASIARTIAIQNQLI